MRMNEHLIRRVNMHAALSTALRKSIRAARRKDLILFRFGGFFFFNGGRYT